MIDEVKNLLLKAKAAHRHWNNNDSLMTQTKAMVELFNAIEEVEPLMDGDLVKYNSICGWYVRWKRQSTLGDPQVFELGYYKNFDGTKCLILDIYTLTSTPGKYQFTKVLREIMGKYYINNTIVMPVEAWMQIWAASNELLKLGTEKHESD